MYDPAQTDFITYMHGVDTYCVYGGMVIVLSSNFHLMH